MDSDLWNRFEWFLVFANIVEINILFLQNELYWYLLSLTVIFLALVLIRKSYHEVGIVYSFLCFRLLVFRKALVIVITESENLYCYSPLAFMHCLVPIGCCFCCSKNAVYRRAKIIWTWCSHIQMLTMFVQVYIYIYIRGKDCSKFLILTFLFLCFNV